MKILILGDNRILQKFWTAEFGDDGIEVIGAFSVTEAENLFNANKSDINLVAVDACVLGINVSAIAPFVERVRAGGYRGPMVSMSSFEDHHRQLADAGCDGSCEKEYLPQEVKKRLLVIQPRPVAI